MNKQFIHEKILKLKPHWYTYLEPFSGLIFIIDVDRIISGADWELVKAIHIQIRLQPTRLSLFLNKQFDIAIILWYKIQFTQLLF